MSVVRESHFSEKLDPKKHENLDDLTIVWFDRNVNKCDDCIDLQSRIRAVINDPIVFDDCSLCKDYLLGLEQEKIFLIVSGTDGESLVHSTHHLSKIHYIYTYCFEKASHEQWPQKYVKNRGTYDNKDDLLKKLKEDAQTCLLEILPMRPLGIKAMQKSLKELNEEGGLFIWWYSLLNILRTMEHDQNAKIELIELSRQQYKGDQTELGKILDFENNYTADKAIRWYSRDSFIYRLLNKALRTENFDVIFKFRLIIADVHQQLKAMHANYIKEIFSPSKRELTVYRGQILPMNEFKKLEENGFISMNTFLSTSTSSVVALDYSGNGERRPSFESVLFEINIEESNSMEPFANVSQVSFFNDENEVFFTIGTIFQINSVEELSPTISLIKLSLVKHSDENTARLTQYLNESIPSKPTLHNLNQIFLMIDDYPRVVRYSEILLKQSSITDANRAGIYLTLGDAEVKIKGNYEEAQNWYLKAKELALSVSPCNYDLLACVYSSIGLLEIEKNNHSIGIESLNKSLQVAIDNSLDSDQIFRIYSNLGLAYRNMSKYDQACEMYETALNIIKQPNELPEYHPLHSVILNNLAYTKQLQHQYDRSLEYYNLAYTIQKKSLPKVHSVTATTLSNIALLHMMKGEDETAIKKYEEARTMFTEIYGCDHPRLATVFNNIGDLYLRMEQYQQAKDYLNKALEIRLNNPDNDDDNNLAAVYTSLAFVHCRLNLFDESLIFSCKALNIRHNIPSTKTNNISITYMAVAEYYSAQFDYDQALYYYTLAQDNCPPESFDFAIILERIGETFHRRQKYDEVIQYIQESIDIQLKLPSRNNNHLVKSYRDIGQLYGKKGQFREALSCFNQGLDLEFNNSFSRAELNLAIAEVFLQLTDFKQSSDYLNKAKCILNEIADVNDYLQAKMFFITGILNSKEKNFRLAAQNFKASVTAFEKHSSNLFPLLCEAYKGLASTLLELNKTDEALQILEKVQTIGSLVYADDPSVLVPFYYRISTTLRNKGRLEESLVYANYALDITINSEPINYYSLSNTYNHLSSIYLQKKDFRRARIEIMNNFIICHKHCPDNLVLFQIHLANIYIVENSTQEAIQLLNGIPDDYLQCVRNYSPARLRTDIAFIYNSVAQYDSSLRMIHLALNYIAKDEHNIIVQAENLAAEIFCMLQQRAGTLEHLNPMLAIVYNCLGKHYLSIENNLAAVKHFETALDIRLRYMDVDNSQLDPLYTNINELYVKNKTYQELENVYGELMKKLAEQVDDKNIMKIGILLGLAYARKMCTNQSLYYCELAIALSLNMDVPNYEIAAFIYNHISEVYRSLGNMSGFIKANEKAIEMVSKIGSHGDKLIENS